MWDKEGSEKFREVNWEHTIAHALMCLLQRFFSLIIFFLHQKNIQIDSLSATGNMRSF